MIVLPSEQLEDFIKSYEREANALRESIADLCFVSRGSVGYGDAWFLSAEDRETMVRVINRRNREANPDAKEYM